MYSLIIINSLNTSMNCEGKGETESFEELIEYLQEFERSRLQENVGDAESIEQLGELSLTNVLQIIVMHLKSESYRQKMAEFIMNKCSYIVNCIFFHANATFQDYFLLYDIITLASKLQQQQQSLILQIEQALFSISQDQKNQMIEDFFKLICMLWRIKLLDKKSLSERDRLKQFCLNPNVNEIVVDFAVRMIKGRQIGDLNGFPFLKMRMGDRKYGKILKKETEAKDKVNDYHMKQPNNLQENAMTKKTTKEDKSQAQTQSLQCKESLPDRIRCLSSNNCANNKQNAKAKEILDSIKSLSIEHILKMDNQIWMVTELLRLSFLYPQIINISVSSALFLMPIDQFINLLRPILHSNTSKPNQPLKKALKKIIQQNCGSQSSHIWSRLTLKD